MKRVADLLQREEHRQALVRLWVLGSDAQRLNAWERNRGPLETMEAAATQFRADLDRPKSLNLNRIESAPLALIRALDDHVAGSDSPYNRASRGGRETLAREEDGKDYWLLPIALQTRRLASLNQQVGNLGAWFRRHVVLPSTTAHGLHVTLSQSQSSVDDALTRLWEQEPPALKVWIGHFNDTAQVQWTCNDLGNVRTTDIAPQKVRTDSLLAAMDSAAKHGAHIVVFPEFALDLEQRKALVKHLRTNSYASLILVVAGSFHEDEGDETFNTAPLYSASGQKLLTHRKLRVYGDLNHGAEDVSVGNSIHVLSTPVGCMTVLICKDFIDAHASVDSLLTEVPVDWALVPSFGDEKTIKAHKARAQTLAVVRTGTHSVVAQTLNTIIEREEPPTQCVRGFGHAAGSKTPDPQVGETGGLVIFKLGQQEPPASPPIRRMNLKRIK